MENIVNDFTINIATANGTGSQSANLILLQIIIRYGRPRAAKTCSRLTSQDYRPGI